MGESTADIITRLQERMRPHAVSPATVTRKPTDTATAMTGGPSGDRGAVLDGTRPGTGRHPRVNTNANKRGGGRYPGTFRVTAEYLAGSPVQATERATAPAVTPSHGTRVAGRTTLAQAEAIGTDGGYRAWVRARANLTRDTGEVPATGESYPRGTFPSGSLSPSARF